MISAVTGTKSAQALGEAQMAVAARMLKTANLQGQAVLELVQSAAQGMDEAIQQVATAAGPGGQLDVVA